MAVEIPAFDTSPSVNQAEQITEVTVQDILQQSLSMLKGVREGQHEVALRAPTTRGLVPARLRSYYFSRVDDPNEGIWKLERADRPVVYIKAHSDEESHDYKVSLHSSLPFKSSHKDLLDFDDAQEPAEILQFATHAYEAQKVEHSVEHTRHRLGGLFMRRPK